MEKWFVSMKKADFTQIAEKYHISPIIAISYFPDHRAPDPK